VPEKSSIVQLVAVLWVSGLSLELEVEYQLCNRWYLKDPDQRSKQFTMRIDFTYELDPAQRQKRLKMPLDRNQYRSTRINHKVDLQ
jgi:hypothetical protein